MKKSEVNQLFGGTTRVCEALQMSARSWYRWDDELTQAQTDRVVGAYVRVTEAMDRQIVHRFEIIGEAK